MEAVSPVFAALGVSGYEALDDLAHWLDDPVVTVERIITAENPAWRNLGCDPAAIGIGDRRTGNIETIRRER